MLAVRLLGVGPPTDASESMTLQGVALKTYVDDELKYLIGIFLMPPVLILGSLLIDRSDAAQTVVAGLILGWLGQLLVPACRITEVAPDHLVIRTPVRRLHVTPETIVSIKGIHEGQWRAHVSVRTKRRVYIEVRVWMFTHKQDLASTLLSIAEKAGPGVARPAAVRILQKSISDPHDDDAP